MSRYAPQKSVDDLENMLRLKQSDWLGACQEIDRLNTELSRLREQNAELKAKYHELLFHVATKHPSETRHETALRYIRQAERPSMNAEQPTAQGEE